MTFAEVSALGSDYPYEVLVNVGVAELEDLRKELRQAIGKLWSSDHEVKFRNEAIVFCFADYLAAMAFEGYCLRNQIPYSREWSWPNAQG